MFVLDTTQEPGKLKIDFEQVSHRGIPYLDTNTGDSSKKKFRNKTKTRRLLENIVKTRKQFIFCLTRAVPFIFQSPLNAII